MSETRLTSTEVVDLLERLILDKTAVTFNEEKQTLLFNSSDNTPCELLLPLVFPLLRGGSPENLLHQLESMTRNYTIILIQAGAAAIGWYKNGVLDKHRIIKKYMIRKSQGTAQLKYLKSKGKSRLGSRIRLKNSILFFNEINETLTEWSVAKQSETLLLSLPINLIHPLFTADTPVPFDKKDPRLKKIPIDVHIPGSKELGHIHWLVSRGLLKRQE